MAPHSSTLAWKIPWMEEPGGPKSMGSLRVGQDSVTSLSLFTFLHWRRKWQPTPVFLPGESQGQGSLVGCRLWGHRVRHDWGDLAAAGKMIIRLGLPRKVPIFIYHLSVLIKNSSPFTSQNCLSLDNKLCINLGWWDPVFSCGYAQRKGKWLWPSHFVDLMFLMCKMKLYVKLEYFNQYWYFVNLTVIHRLCILFCKITSKVYQHVNVLEAHSEKRWVCKAGWGPQSILMNHCDAAMLQLYMLSWTIHSLRPGNISDSTL